MTEEQKHIEAFEEFYVLGGVASKENVTYLSDKCQVSERTIWRWYNDYEWKKRTQIRNEVIRRELEKITNSKLIENKAKYLSFAHKLLDNWKIKIDNGKNTVEIKSVSDFYRIVSLAVQLQEQ